MVPWKKTNQLITTLNAKQIPTAHSMPLTARSYLPAPLFCEANADTACENAEGTSMTKPHTFSATPTPAETIRPSELTMARMTMNEMLTIKSCSAIGNPSPRILLICVRCQPISLSENVNGSCILLIRNSETATLIS